MNESKPSNAERKNQKGEPYTEADLAQIHGASGVNILAGIWLWIAPFYLGYPRPISRWNDIIVGLVLFVMAGWRWLRPYHHFWISWVNAYIGLWMIAAPFVLRCDLVRAQMNDMTVGFIVFLAGAISGSVRSYGR